MPRIANYLAAGLMLAAVGCSSSTGPETAHISGTVLLDGAPAAGVDVTFMNGEYSAFARTDGEGKFELETGAAVGDNSVYFSKIEGQGLELDAAEGMDEGQLMAMRDPGLPAARVPRQLIPPQYSDPAKTTVHFDVPGAGADDVEFQLTSKQVSK